jgi:hypothetical protein
LRKFIVKDLGSVKDGEIQDDALGTEGNAPELNVQAFEEAVLVHDTNSQKVRALI